MRSILMAAMAAALLAGCARTPPPKAAAPGTYAGRPDVAFQDRPSLPGGPAIPILLVALGAVLLTSGGDDGGGGGQLNPGDGPFNQ